MIVYKILKEKISKVGLCCDKKISDFKIVNIFSKILSKKYFNDEMHSEKYKEKISKIILKSMFVITGVIISILVIFVKFDEKDIISNVENIKMQEFNDEDTKVELIAKIKNGIYEMREKYVLTVPKTNPSNEEIVDRLLSLIDEEYILGNNNNLNEITEELNLETKNVYNANIKWESLKGYVNVHTGEVLRNKKGLGDVKDVLKVTINYFDITKVKEFKITILENNMDVQEIELKKDKCQLDDIVKNSEVFVRMEDNKIKLIDNVGTSKIEWYEQIKSEDSKNKDTYYIIVLIFVGVYILVCLSDIKSVYKEEKMKVEELEKEFPNFISKYMLLNKAGYNVINTIEYLCECSDELYFYKTLKKVLRKVKSGKYIYHALDEFGKETGSKNIKRFVNNLISNTKRGNKNINDFFKEELKDAHENKKILFRKKVEENSVKILFSFILILIATMIIIVYPAIISLEI